MDNARVLRTRAEASLEERRSLLRVARFPLHRAPGLPGSRVVRVHVCAKKKNESVFVLLL